MSRVKKSPALKGVKVTSLDLLLDDIMSGVPMGTLDLSKPEARERVRGWLQRVGRHIALETSIEMAEGAGKAVREAALLFINPAYYDDQKKRRTKRRAESAIKKVEDANKHRMIHAFGKNTFIQ